MKKITFNEIIEASTQKSIVSEQPGFGIRTYTKGMDADFVRKVVEQVGCAYEVSIDRQLSAQTLKDDPSATLAFPRTLKYTTVTDADGNEKYVVACSTYVGIDYGYFCGLESAQRAGTNYVADILVLDERPTAALFSRLLEQGGADGVAGVFVPADNTCRPDNAELRYLLTGEPELLEPRSIELDDAAWASCGIDDMAASVAMALLQTKVNADTASDESLRNIVFQTKEADVPDVLKCLSLLPDGLVTDKYFQTNYLQGYGMPNGYRMIFINEYNEEEVYTDNYVYLNLCDGTTKNIDTDNYIFMKLREAAAHGDMALLRSLAEFMYGLTCSSDSDYHFLYNLFVTTKTDLPVMLDELTPDFFTKVDKARLPSDSQAALCRSVSRTVSEAVRSVGEALEAGKSRDNCARAVDVLRKIDYIHANFPQLLNLSVDDDAAETTGDKTRLTNMLFLDGMLGEAAGCCSIPTLRYMNTCDVSPDDYLAALRHVGNDDVWVALIGDRFPGYANDGDTSAAVIDAVMESDAPDRERLLLRLFPIDDNGALLSGYMCKHPDVMPRLAGMVRTLCLKRGNDQMVAFLEAGHFADGVVRQLQPVAKEYFSKCVDEDVCRGIEVVGRFAEAVGDGNFCRFDFMSVIDRYADYCFAYPDKARVEWLEFFLDNAQLSDVAGARLQAICRLRGKSVTDDSIHGDADELLIAKRLGLPLDVRLRVMGACIRKAIDTDSLKRYMDDGNKPGVPEMYNMIDKVWACRPDIGDADCDRYTVSIVENGQWTKKMRDDYVAMCRDPRIVECFKDNFSFFKLMKRKLLK